MPNYGGHDHSGLTLLIASALIAISGQLAPCQLLIGASAPQPFMTAPSELPAYQATIKPAEAIGCGACHSFVDVTRVLFAGSTTKRSEYQLSSIGISQLFPGGKVSPDTSAWQFDTVSIRPSGADEIGPIGVFPDEYRAVGWPFLNTLLMAYFPPSSSSEGRIVGAPEWSHDKYTIVAKVAPNDIEEWQKRSAHWDPSVPNAMLQTMLQAALADRCKIVVHRRLIEGNGFALTVGKHGLNVKAIQKSAPDGVVPSNALQMPKGGWMVPVTPEQKQRGQQLHVTFFHSTMPALAATLSILTGLNPIEDRTGLTGQYGFTLYRSDDDSDQSRNGPATYNLGALGLKLEPIKVPQEILVIDRIARPSPN